MVMRHWRARALKWKMRKAQRNRCAICGRSFGPIMPTFEHVQPRSRGGEDEGNLVLTHNKCNQQRGADLPTGCLMLMLDVVNTRLGR
jgi:5-methylcytosine-specific restriction endonuclease McrA